MRNRNAKQAVFILFAFQYLSIVLVNLSFLLCYCHAPYFGVIMTTRAKTGGVKKHASERFHQADGITKSTHNQAGSQSSVRPPHPTPIAIILSYCLDNVQLDSVAVLDIAFQVT